MKTLFIILLALVSLTGCTGPDVSEQPPIHLVQNMDDQPKVKQQSESRFYADGLAMRQPVEGTVARGQLREDSAFYYAGLNDDSSFVTTNPRDGTIGLPDRGKGRFGIYCVPCHGPLGDARSVMVEKKIPIPPSFHEQRLRDSTDGYFYHVITNGLGNMPPYKYQIPPRDRWAIVAHLRSLQQSQPAVPNSTPESRIESREAASQ
jgi:mono/diheme cytochrome c family protein